MEIYVQQQGLRRDKGYSPNMRGTKIVVRTYTLNQITFFIFVSQNTIQNRFRDSRYTPRS